MYAVNSFIFCRLYQLNFLAQNNEIFQIRPTEKIFILLKNITMQSKKTIHNLIHNPIHNSQSNSQFIIR